MYVNGQANYSRTSRTRIFFGDLKHQIEGDEAQILAHQAHIFQSVGVDVALTSV